MVRRQALSMASGGIIKVVGSNSHYSHIKNWDRKFFFVSNARWEFPVGEVSHREFPIRASWHCIPNGYDFDITLSRSEAKSLGVVYSWFEENPNAVWSNAILTKENIDYYFLQSKDQSLSIGHLAPS